MSLLTPGNYFRWLFATVVAGFMVVVAFNALIDPLGVSPLRVSISGVNLQKPRRANFDRLVKPYDVGRNAARTLFMGSSRVKQSMDPSLLDGSPFAPAYNAGIDNGANLEEIRHLLEYFFSVNDNIRTVYIELFLSSILHYKDIAATPPLNPWQLQWERMLALISGSAFRYSIETIRTNRTSSASPSVSFDSGFVPGIVPAFRLSVDNIPDQLYRTGIIGRSPKASMDSVRAVQKIVDLCRRYQVDCRFFISPLHTDILYGFYFAGLWDDFVALKKGFAKIAPTYDFTRYNDLVDERSGPITYWWEAFHYSPALGALMMRVMTGGTPPGLPANFGVLLNSGNVDAETKAWDVERDRWISRYPLIKARFEAAYNNNFKAASYKGVLNEPARQLIVNDTVYKLIPRSAGSVEFASRDPSYALGWVGDISSRNAARAVAIFQEMRLAAYAEPNMPRPDLSTDNSNMLSYAGFFAPITRVKKEQFAFPLRAFALYGDGTAAELEYAPTAAGFRGSKR